MDRREAYYKASPLYHASQQNAARTRWLVSWGTEDDVVNPRQSTVFVEHLKRANALVRIAPIPGASHFWQVESTVEESPILTFFAQRLFEFLETWAGWTDFFERAGAG
jgi:pimeloyl-ACP methyl ester carboxylesterase